MTTPSQPNDELSKAIELLPCPFCGLQPVLKTAGETKYWWIGCEIHLCPVVKGCGVGHSSHDKQMAIYRWNNQLAAKRSKELEKENEQLKSTIQQMEHGKQSLEALGAVKRIVNKRVEVLAPLDYEVIKGLVELHLSTTLAIETKGSNEKLV